MISYSIYFVSIGIDGVCLGMNLVAKGCLDSFPAVQLQFHMLATLS